MAQVALTVEYSCKGRADLALPDNVASQFLAESLAVALGLAVKAGSLWSLALVEPGGKGSRKISPASSLQDAGVLVGSVLVLAQEVVPDGGHGYLISSTRVRFLLKDINLIGRRYEANLVDIDLMPLSLEKVISRTHARITQRGIHYMIEDMKSRHGTWVNGQRVTTALPLHDGEEILFGPAGRGAVLMFKFHS